MDEKLRILKMLEEGKITAEQASELLGALGSQDPSSEYSPVKSENPYDQKMFRIKVDSVEGDKVNVQFPIRAVKKLLKITGKLPIPEEHMQGIDLMELTDAVVECLDSQSIGDIVDIKAADGTIVKVYID